jgi:flagellar biosynthesis/type III secretory pathway protein FliH
MSSSPKRGRIVPAAVADEDVFLLGRSERASVELAEPVATAAVLVDAAVARRRRAEEEAETLLLGARGEADGVRHAAWQDGFAAGREEGRAAAAAEAAELLGLVRRAAEEGRSVRDGIVEQASNVIARAAMLVARRIVAEYYEADAARTAIAVQEAIRAAATQQVVSVRVHPAAVAAVQARVVDMAGLVLADDAVEIGGAIVDVKNGQLDASLDARFTMMELALQRATGGAS